MISIPENDENKRFLLGKNGNNNLLIICLNPSTANSVKHDGTTDNIEKISIVNGYDGWVLFNLSPQRSPYPKDLFEKPVVADLNKNIKMLEGILEDSNWNIQNVWLAWGNNITTRKYLKEQVVEIIGLIKKYSLVCWHIKKTQKGHPFHPSKQSINKYIGPVNSIFLKKFDIKEYRNKIN